MNQTNYIILSGKVYSTPRFDHECHGEQFYIFTLAVERQSGNVDYVPVMCSERLFSYEVELTESKEITVKGQVRSYDNTDAEGHNHCVMVVFARWLYASKEPNVEDYNYVRLEGRICKTPTYRVTPFGRKITDLCLAVNRMYGKSDYIHGMCWGRNARYVSHLQVGARLVVEGRFQSRTYKKKVVTEEGTYEEERIAYEISYMKVYDVPEE